MTKFTAIVSTKGGVGKTTLAINLALLMKNIGLRSILVDSNLTNPNVSLHLGNPVPAKTLHDVLDGKISLEEATYQHSSGLKLIPSSSDIEDIKYDHFSNIGGCISNLRGSYDMVILDTPPGINEGIVEILKISDEAIVVVNPTFPSVVDGLKIIELSKKLGSQIRGFVVNGVKEKGHELSISHIELMLGQPLLGIIPHDEAVNDSLSIQHPVVYSHPESKAARSMTLLAHNLLGLKVKN